MRIKLLFFLAVSSILLCAQIGRPRAQAGREGDIFAAYLAGLSDVKFVAQPLPHYTGIDNGRKLYIFQSRRLQTSASGFGGPLDLVIVVTPELFIEKIFIEKSYESPQYLKKIKPWLAEFTKKPLADFLSPPYPVDAVTQATHTSAAVIETVLRTAALSLAEIFEQGKTGKAQKSIAGLGQAIILLLFSFGGIHLFHNSQSKKIRLLFLGLLVLVIGFGYNLQFSFQQIVNLLRLNPPPISYLSLAMVTFLPFALAVFYGRIYCGWICPFGALQELIAALGRPIKVSQAWEKKTAFLKYALLAILAFLFYLKKDSAFFARDPLARAFIAWGSLSLDNLLLWIVLFFSLFFVRFWCRYFCPAGAVLSLFNKFALFKFAFKKNYRRCPWYVSKPRDLSCILCNRCQNR